MQEEYKYVDLSYLEEMTGDNIELRKEIIRLFKKQSGEIINNMKREYQAGEIEKLRSVIHKAKATILVVGINELVEEIKKIEKMSNYEVNNYDMQKFIFKFEDICPEAAKELDNYINNL